VAIKKLFSSASLSEEQTLREFRRRGWDVE